MRDMDKRVLEETERFRSALPQLMKELPGRWVVYRDGVVQSDHNTEDEAYSEAIRRFGPNSGFIVVQVVGMQPTPVTASMAYGTLR